jgi:hypothetical protein
MSQKYIVVLFSLKGQGQLAILWLTMLRSQFSILEGHILRRINRNIPRNLGYKFNYNIQFESLSAHH